MDPGRDARHVPNPTGRASALSVRGDARPIIFKSKAAAMRVDFELLERGRATFDHHIGRIRATLWRVATARVRSTARLYGFVAVMEAQIERARGGRDGAPSGRPMLSTLTTRTARRPEQLRQVRRPRARTSRPRAGVGRARTRWPATQTRGRRCRLHRVDSPGDRGLTARATSGIAGELATARVSQGHGSSASRRASSSQAFAKRRRRARRLTAIHPVRRSDEPATNPPAITPRA